MRGALALVCVALGAADIVYLDAVAAPAAFAAEDRPAPAGRRAAIAPAAQATPAAPAVPVAPVVTAVAAAPAADADRGPALTIAFAPDDAELDPEARRQLDHFQVGLGEATPIWIDG